MSGKTAPQARSSRRNSRRRGQNTESPQIIRGDNLDNTLVGGPENSIFVASEGNDSYTFGGGNDTIDYSDMGESIQLIRGGVVNKGKLGADTFNDFYSSIKASNLDNDWIDGISGGGQIASLAADLSENKLEIQNIPGIGDVEVKIQNFENIDGSDTADQLKGDRKNNIINGNGGNDAIISGGGNDTYSFGDGTDTIDYSQAKQSIRLIRGGTVDKGRGEVDTFNDFYETIKASNLKEDWIDGLSGGGQIASLNADLENNLLEINGLPGIGSVSVEAINFEHIDGSDTDDNLKGDAGENILRGNNGNDILTGGRGADILSGGNGNDIFSFSNGDSTLKRMDNILDFNINEDIITGDSADADVESLGSINSLSKRSTSRLLSTESFTANQSVLFTVAGDEAIERTFLAINNAQDGFQPKLDSIIEITGYTGNTEEIVIT